MLEKIRLSQILAIAVMIPVLGVTLGTATPAHATVSCGDTITVDTTLYADLLDCAGDGLIIGRNNVFFCPYCRKVLGFGQSRMM